VPHTPRNLAALAVALGLLGPPPASAGEEDLSIQDARRVAVAKVKKLEHKLRDTGATGSGVPGCWRETRRRVGCLGMVRGADALVRWRCAVPMTVRKRSEAAAAATGRRLAVEFTDTMCAF
jgi:hypothetical protein